MYFGHLVYVFWPSCLCILVTLLTRFIWLYNLLTVSVPDALATSQPLMILLFSHHHFCCGINRTENFNSSEDGYVYSFINMHVNKNRGAELSHGFKFAMNWNFRRDIVGYKYILSRLYRRLFDSWIRRLSIKKYPLLL
jgi:hypothetical protein